MSKAILFAATIPILAVLAQVTPSEPAPGNVYNEGSTCNVQWEADTTGTWTEMNIQLMTGSNSQMVHLTTVATVDGTSTTETSFSYPCPSVTPNSAIYFYQFSTPSAPTNLTWTGRFAIADPSGNTVPPPQEEDGVQFGVGELTDPSSASPAPSYLGGGTTGVSNTTIGGGANSSLTDGTTDGESTGRTVQTTSATGALTATGSLTRNTAAPTRSVDSDQASESGTGNGNGNGNGNGSSTPAEQTANDASALLHDLKARGLKALMGLVSTAVVFAAML